MNEIADLARGWIGTPYRHRAATRRAGCDCLGLLVGVWREAGGTVPDLPAYRADWRDMSHAEELQALAARWLVPAAEIAPGRILLFRIGMSPLPRHCGIALGGGRFVHAQERLGVVEGNLTLGWLRRVSGIFGFPAGD
ncbi:NlpC/P60 family protein [Devosia sp.]|uniref:NlpC/P60 family protein n=1 Tax=Devosia sp. TaxID=1871048 RepID=UPI003A902D92